MVTGKPALGDWARSSCALKTAIFLLAVVITASSLPAGTVYVDDDSPACGPRDGSESCPYLAIQDGIDAAVVRRTSQR